MYIQSLAVSSVANLSKDESAKDGVGQGEEVE